MLEMLNRASDLQREKRVRDNTTVVCNRMVHHIQRIDRIDQHAMNRGTEALWQGTARRDAKRMPYRCCSDDNEVKAPSGIRSSR